MTDATPTKIVRLPELAKSEPARQQSQTDLTAPTRPQTPENRANPPVHPTAPGRKPLFRS
jgi:hypothetical protein